MAKEKEFELNRKKYQEIRKMDHNEMQQYLNAVYRNGLAAGVKTAPTFDANTFMQAISRIKGIGPAKYEQIRLAMIAAGGKTEPGMDKVMK